MVSELRALNTPKTSIWRTVLLCAVMLLAVAACSAAPDTPAAPAEPVLSPSATAPVSLPSVTAAATLPPTVLAPTAAPTEAPTPLPTEAPTVEPIPTLALEPADLASLRLRLLPVADGLRGPLFVTHAGDGSGRLFVVEQPGVIRVIADGNLVETPFLDIRDRAGSNASEQGLLGLAFAPDYPGSGQFFVNYTDRSGRTVVARFSVTDEPNVADPGTEFRVLIIDQPAANHNGGMLAFGPDGYLWIGAGDGGAANDRFGNGQNPDTLLGKMLRLDVTTNRSVPYLIPGDNPWVSADWDGRDMRDEVWAVGLRNPWRYSFDRATGDLWIADVGQNRYEEVHYVPAGSVGGLNFGWPIMEGTHCFPQTADCQRTGLEIPVAEYAHGTGDCSITGGYVYRGAQFPALAGVYLYGDYCSGKIWGLARAGDGWRSAELLPTGINISSFGEDQAGELYITDLRRGGVYRVVVE